MNQALARNKRENHSLEFQSQRFRTKEQTRLQNLGNAHKTDDKNFMTIFLYFEAKICSYFQYLNLK